MCRSGQAKTNPPDGALRGDGEAMSVSRSVFVIVLVCATVWAARGHAEPFMGEDIVPPGGHYVVSTDVNVRAGPKTSAKKVDTLAKGERVLSPGRAKADQGWVAVLREGEPLGFVYGELLWALIDGSLSERLEGTVEASDGGSCDYRIRFDGRSVVEDDLFTVADYTVKFRCSGAEKSLRFSTPMFMTEAPYRMGARPEYQITLDIVEISDGYDQVFSSTSIYHTAKEIVRFDGTSIPEMASSPEKAERAAPNVAAALVAAVEMAVEAWNERVWTALGRAAHQ
jgi:hypothetical protein